MTAINDETIAAIATPSGQGGIGLVRMCGKNSLSILSTIFKPKNNLDLRNAHSHTIHYGYIVDIGNGNIPVDEVLASIMLSPKTYTKEDTVEISCHGSYIILRKILNLLIKAGARLAEPGEFTKRAFLNGRIDLTQAEAVMDLINAKSEEASKSAIKHLDGYLSRYIKTAQDSVKEILIQLETQIDFIEENIMHVDYNQIKLKLNKISDSLNQIIRTYDQGKLLKDGISIAVIGKANVGKSSLFNILINSPSRALVAHVPGTTRDYIEEAVNINGKLFKFIDTAGFKTPKGIVEKQSLEVTNKCVRDATLVIFLLDGSKILSKKDLEVWELISGKRTIIVVNKTDLSNKLNSKDVNNKFFGRKIIDISCKENKGIEELKKEIVNISDGIFEKSSGAGLVITNVRHKSILEKALSCVNDAVLAAEKKMSTEFPASDLRHALESLQELTGEKITENILDEIFSKFCIGK